MGTQGILTRALFQHAAGLEDCLTYFFIGLAMDAKNGCLSDRDNARVELPMSAWLGTISRAPSTPRPSFSEGKPHRGAALRMTALEDWFTATTTYLTTGMLNTQSFPTFPS